MADRIVTIASSGGDYTSFALAIAGEDDFQAGEDNIIFRKTDSVRDSTGCTVAGFTTSASHQIILESTLSEMHDGTRGSGAGIVATADFTGIMGADIEYVTLRRLELSNVSTSGSYCVYCYASHITLDSCLIYGGAYSVYCRLSPDYIINCIIYGGTTYAVRFNAEDSYVYYTTILNGSYGLDNTTFGTIYSKNNYVGGNSTADYNAAGSFTLTTSASSDGTEGTTEIEVAACNFISSSIGSEDAKIQVGSSLFGAGTSLSSDLVYPVTTDAFGTTRASTPCIGAFEYFSSVVFIPIIIVI